MPKICVISSVHISSDTRIYQKEIISLAKAGYEVVFLNRDCTKVDEYGVQFKKVNIPHSRLKRIVFSQTLMFVSALKEKADVYHFHDPELLFAGVFLALLKKKVIYDVHEDVPRDILEKKYIKQCLRKCLATVFDFFEKKCARLFIVNIVAAPVLIDIFKEHKCKVVCITNYPKLEEFPLLKTKFSDRKSVCYIGELEEFRGIYEMLEAIALSKGGLELGGKFNDESYENKCRESVGWKKVKFHGYLNREEVASIMSSSIGGMITLLPNPRHNFGMPNKMFEYMAAGIPVIASDFPYWRGIVEGGDCGICVDPTSPIEIAKAIDRLIEDPALAKKMGENGRKLSQSKYNWSIEERKLLKLYKLILKKER